ncbi:MAG: NADH-quinone oxidoreductase subunit L [Holophagaceae bacterium]|nr:NADH-quinone oxidoreductase subunit L [Holophagaceae bacterium]
MQKIAWLIPILPLLGSAFNGLIGKKAGKKAVSIVGVGTVAASFLFALWVFFAMKAAPGQRLELVYGTWMATGSLTVPFGLTIDPLSGTMMLVVTGISALIHLYSVGYMADEEGYARYFCYLNLFVFFMLTLVLGNSLPLLFVGWEGVGLCSYLLIGYAFETEVAPAAGLKAFLFNRTGDMGMAIGMMALFALFGTLTIGDILNQAGHMHAEAGFGVLTFATLMLFVGATGKSAQIPLYLWLPDAMAGPTPVSALIHAATMVTSGIYMICRLAPVFGLTPITMTTIAWIGGLTALLAATIGLVQRDIKKVLAYSTVSQLGYMFLGLGSAGFAAGFFHVFTHAWFKALLFLGAGAVIHAMHHEQDLFRMGGLKEKLPITFWTMLIATLCIMGIPGFSGFFSKDEILYLAFLKSPALWAIGLIAACCTAFYMARLMALAFLGEPRDPHAFEHAHEAPATMTLPLVVLAAGAVAAGFWGIPKVLGGTFAIEHWLEPALTFGRAEAETGSVHEGPAMLLMGISVAAAVGFGFFGWSLYKDGTEKSERLAARFPGAHTILLNKYFLDELVEGYLLRPTRWFGNVLWKLFDVILIDGIGVNLPGALTRVAGDFTALLQTGRVRNYVLSMGLGVLALLYIFLK